jgi:hypothetical protein
MILLSCKEVSSAAARGEYAGAPALGRLRAGLHLLICRHCRRFRRQLGLLAQWAAAPFPDEGRVPALEEAVLKRLRGGPGL